MTFDLDKMAVLLRESDAQPFDFASPPELYPPVGHPRALDYFFRVVMHQYGFWYLEDGIWAGSMYAEIGGKRYKGSDFVWASATRALHDGQPSLTKFFDDTGVCPLPMAESHHEMSAAAAAYFAKRSPETILAEARATGRPLKTLLDELARMPGYAEDPLRKKAMLLVFTLVNRPEKFIAIGREVDELGPVVDYHVMRTSLRTGLVDVADPAVTATLESRREIAADDERRIRDTVYAAMTLLQKRSGASHAALDYLFFQARTKCPEASEPDCPHCALDPICAKRKSLFQPVIRTTYY